jgi:SAM-dependent methyltransferase/uncharacterized protein YbaR (Trm112 family)
MLNDLLLENVRLLVCPACRADLLVTETQLMCRGCSATYPISNHGIPLLFCPNDGWTNAKDVTETVQAFYEENPFPNYDDLDSRESLTRKAKQGLFATLLDQQISRGSLVLEVGCGTGQLTNFLGLSSTRKVFGSDMCLHSLRLGSAFRDRFGVNNAAFLQMNLFRPALREDVFDVVISNGVLHHTSDPLRGFRAIGQLVKPGGLILIGLYNKIGRLPTDFRRLLFRAVGDRLLFLDDHMRNKTYNQARKRAWFMDQYKHPHESKHTFGEVLEWFDSNGFEFLCSIPKLDPSPFTSEEQLFAPHPRGNVATRFIAELEILLKGGVDGALFIMIARKKAAQSAAVEPPITMSHHAIEGRVQER